MKNYIYKDGLSSKRLQTRFLNFSDSILWTTFFEDEESVRFLNLSSLGLNSNKAVAEHMVEKQLQRYKENRFGLQAILNKETHELIGLCGLLKQEVDGKEEIEVGYHLFKQHRGQGFASEASQLFIDFAFRHQLSDTIISIIDTGNIKSQRVAERNGLKIDRKTKWLDMDDVFIFRMSYAEWVKNKQEH
jgi:[ribosomal protein S5]-alanine N-acetyltransferase